MTPILVLIPTLIALAMFNTQPSNRIAQKVYLPTLLLMPMYVDFRVGGFVIAATSILVLMLAAAGWLTWSKKLSPADFCVIGLGLTTFYADAHLHSPNIALYAFYFNFTKWVCPYFIGRTLIEQYGMRRPFARTFALCLAAVAVISICEYTTEKDVWKIAVQKLTHIIVTSQGGQRRWGFARITGPYGQAILAGLTFASGLFLQIWLYATKTDFSTKRLRFLRHRRAPLWVTLTVMLGLFMTQSRGPWLGCAFGLVVAATGFAKNRRRAAIVCFLIVLVGGLLATNVLDKYTAIDATKVQDRDQLNAAYRRDLIKTYAPVIEQGGLWGWGSPSYLKNGWFGYVQNKQPSIDNEYMRIAVALGYVGVTLFILTLALCIVHLMKLCATLRAREDFLFAYCMLGALIAASFTISTVALLEPMMQILFLMLGWSQSIQPTKSAEGLAVSATRVQQYQFERVFV